MSERRYDEEETRRIFDDASRERGLPEGGSDLPDGTGFTLAELQAIGAEAGLDAARIAAAAVAIDARSGVAAATRRVAGLPIGVSRVVDLPGFDESSWNRLVVDLRETFEARGRIRVDGAFREWRNGNLRAMVEPTDTGYRLRLRTLKASAYQSLTFAAVAVAVATTILVAGVVNGTPLEGWSVALFLALAGAASAAISAFQLPDWARTREQQMEGVAERALLRAMTPSPRS